MRGHECQPQCIEREGASCCGLIASSTLWSHLHLVVHCLTFLCSVEALLPQKEACSSTLMPKDVQLARRVRELRH